MNAITRERHEEIKGRIEPLLQQVENWRKAKGMTGRTLLRLVCDTAAVRRRSLLLLSN
jgi:hypothetical protein